MPEVIKLSSVKGDVLQQVLTCSYKLYYVQLIYMYISSVCLVFLLNRTCIMICYYLQASSHVQLQQALEWNSRQLIAIASSLQKHKVNLLISQHQVQQVKSLICDSFSNLPTDITSTSN